MKKLVLAAAVLMVSASAHAGTYSYDGVTVHVQDGCRSSSCVSVYAPGYGYYNGGRTVKVRKAHKDTARVAVAKRTIRLRPQPRRRKLMCRQRLRMPRRRNDFDRAGHFIAKSTVIPGQPAGLHPEYRDDERAILQLRSRDTREEACPGMTAPDTG